MKNEEKRIRCPYCAEDIAADAKKCKHCGEWLDGRSEGAGEDDWFVVFPFSFYFLRQVIRFFCELFRALFGKEK